MVWWRMLRSIRIRIRNMERWLKLRMWWRIMLMICGICWWVILGRRLDFKRRRKWRMWFSKCFNDWIGIFRLFEFLSLRKSWRNLRVFVGLLYWRFFSNVFDERLIEWIKVGLDNDLVFLICFFNGLLDNISFVYEIVLLVVL